MPQRDTNLFSRIQAIFNVLAGVTEVPELPSAFSEPAFWEINRDALTIPTVWRRRSRAR